MSPTISLESRKPAPVSSFQELLDGIRSIFDEATNNEVDVDEIWKVLEDYRSTPSDWCKYAHYDIHKYKRNLVDEHEKYNIMILSWGPGTKSCIHDHSGSHCFMKMLDGELIESRFAWPDEDQVKHENEMSFLSESRMKENSVLYINDKVGLHRVENPNANRTAASLHVYIPPFRKCKVFDQRTGQARDCRMTFYSKRGKVVMDDAEVNPWLK